MFGSPRQHACDGGHDGDPTNADNNLHDYAGGKLRQDCETHKREQDAEAIDCEGVFSAADHRHYPRPHQAVPVQGHKPLDQDGKREKMQEAQGRKASRMPAGVVPDLAGWGYCVNLARSTVRIGLAGPRDNGLRGG